VEGGYFRETFKADKQPSVHTDRGNRVTMTSIYYLLTAQSPIGHFHKNHSDIMHYFHAGDAIRYTLLHPNGEVQYKILGPDLTQGHEFQFVVPAGVWKASELLSPYQFGYGLIGEAVAPGFEFADMQLAERASLISDFPQHREIIEALTR
jgi:predicted cupin superfamily sugar epimerase